MREYLLKELTIKIGSGSTPKGGKESYRESGITLVRSMNVFDFKFKVDGLAYIGKEQANKLKNVTVQKNDILLNITGASVARACVIPRNLLPARVNQHVCIIRIDETKADPHYILNYLNSPAYKKFLLSLASAGATREALTKEGIESLKINIPPLPTQQKIASTLSAYDDLIENNTQRIQLLEEMAEEIYKEWFVRLRFPGYQDAKFFDKNGKEVAHGTKNALPEGWKNGTIGDLIEVKKGKNITAATVTEGVIPVVAGGLTPAYYHNTPNTTSPTITISASGANSGFVNLYYEDIWASDCSYIDSNMTNILYFLYTTLKTRQKEIFYLQKGSAQPHVYPTDIMSLHLKYPDHDLMNKCEDILTPFYEEIRVLKSKNQILQETRDLLLPRLISGKLSVESLENNKQITKEELETMQEE